MVASFWSVTFCTEFLHKVGLISSHQKLVQIGQVIHNELAAN